MSRVRFLFVLTALLTCLAWGLAPSRAQADATQLCRSVSSILLSPPDIVAAPYIAYRSIRTNLEEYDDTRAVKIAYMVPGYTFFVGMQVYGTGVRIVAGALEFVPGLFTLFREGSARPFFQSQDEAEALYSNDFGPCPVRIGVSYTAAG
jgi:hypothetical protein